VERIDLRALRQEVKILTRESLLLAVSVIVLTTVLALVQWRVGGPTHGATIGELGLKFGVTAYVLGAVIRLMLRIPNNFLKWARGVRKT
jgi:hypothetical protein